MIKEREILNEFLTGRSLRQSKQRDIILSCFLSTEKHLAAEELHDLIKEGHPGIGLATVHRTLKLFAQCGLAREVHLGDKRTYFEHDYQHRHHDHLVCRRCGRIREFLEPGIEKLQQTIAQKYGFTIESHRLEIYGTCKSCR